MNALGPRVESDIWAQDPTLAGLPETALYELGSGWLQRVHRDVHKALDLPGVRLRDLSDTYPRVRIAKALDADTSERMLHRSYETLRRILASRSESDAIGGAPVEPELYDDLVDATTDKWLAEGKLRSRAEKTAAVSYISGLLPVDPTAPRSASRLESFTWENGDRHKERVAYAKARAAMYVTRIDQNTRHAMRSLLYDFEQSGASVSVLEQQLRGVFGTLNRDWRRIALTETAFNRANGMLAALKLGTRVRWTAAADACPHCRRMHDRSFEVVDPHRSDKDAQTMIWVGKSSAERDSTGRRRAIGSWPAIPMHPHCRCAWTALIPHVAPVSEAFEDIMRDLMERATAA